MPEASTPGSGVDGREQPIEKLRPVDRVRVPAAREVHVVVSTWLASKPLSTSQQPGQARHQKAGDDQQRRAEAHLETDQRFAQAQAGSCFRGRVAAGAKRGLRIVAREAPGRKHAEQSAGRHGQDETRTARTFMSRPTSLSLGNIEGRRGDEQLSVQPAMTRPRMPPTDAKQQTLGQHLGELTPRGWRRAPFGSRPRGRATPSARAGDWPGSRRQ